VFLLALFTLGIIIVGMWAFTSWAERHHRRQSRKDGGA